MGLRQMIGAALIAGGLPLIAAAQDMAEASLTSAEITSFRRAIEACLQFEPIDEEAVVVIGFDLTPDGYVDGSVRLVGSSEGPPETIDMMFNAARQAVLRCGQDGYDLPAEKYALWRSVELRFDASGMANR